MIEYLEIINKIKYVDENAIKKFNEKVSIPLILSNLDAIISVDEKKMFIKKNDIVVILEESDRKAFSETLIILKQVDRNLFNKIDFKVIDFFEKFKILINKKELELDTKNLEPFTLEILSILNIKYWCETIDEKKEYLDIMKKNNKIFDKKIENKKEIKKVENKKDNLSIVKNTWWNKLLNKIREIKNRAQKY